MLDIRRTLPTDASAIVNVGCKAYAVAFQDSMSPTELEALLDREYSPETVAELIDSESVLVAELDGDVAGFAVVVASDEEMVRWAQWELRKLYVDPRFQSRGIGSALIEAALSARPTCDFVLDVWKENAGAQRLYERLGFTHVGPRSSSDPEISNSEPDLVMVRRRS